jgi:predicted ATPase
MLQRVYVDNYRCLVNFDCQFAARQLLLGANGSGKTTLFDVLLLLRDFCAYGLQYDAMFLGLSTTRWQEVPTQSFELDVVGNGGTFRFRLVVDAWGSPARPRVSTEEVLFDGKPVFRFANGDVQLFNDRHEAKVTYPFDWHRSALATITERRENTKLTWFKRWLSQLSFFSPDPRQMHPVAEKEAAWPARNLSNFASWYRHLRLEDDDQALLQDLREVIPGFHSMDLKDVGMGNRVLTVTFADQSQWYGFGELSDGQRVLIALYTILHFVASQPTVLLLDEPDNFIALGEILPWLDKLLDRAEESGAQIFVLSHHPELLNRMAVEGGILFDRPQGRHTRARRYHDSADTGLSPAELVARGWENE